MNRRVGGRSFAFAVPYFLETRIMTDDDASALVKYFRFKREPTCGTRCIDMGRIFSAPNSSYPPYPEKLPRVYKEVTVGRKLNELHLVYIDSGSGWYKNDQGDSFRIVPGTALLLYPNAYHSYAPDKNSGWSEYWVGCDGAYPEWLIGEDAFPKKNTLTQIGQFRGLSDDFSQLCLLAKSRHNPVIKSQLLGGMINRLLGRLLVLQNSPANQIEQDARNTLDDVIAYLDANVEADINMTELPAMAGMRYDRLSKLFQDRTGMTPHQYYLDKKITLAVELLRSGLSVKETSYRLCFESPYYFSRLFKKKTGVSPQSYKSCQS